MNSGERGFSLIELLVATLVLTVISGAMFTLLTKDQETFVAENDFVEATQNARLTMDMVSSVVRQAGNNPNGVALTPFTLVNWYNDANNNVVCREISIQSDITGSTSQANGTGDPDGTVNSPWENVTFRFASGTPLGEVQMRTTAAGPFQPIAKNIQDVRFLSFDKNGAATSTAADIAKIGIQVDVRTTYLDPKARSQGLTLYRSFTLTSDAYVRSKQ
ncbi:MAG: prepilin-type N-terminal cleavage/methylation domain-containing protein [Acidobacteria bacterium]|nr:prepilin-type N-terminal cleavage/methylation domain-containing protein [Acidobacteriota bacterium]